MHIDSKRIPTLVVILLLALCYAITRYVLSGSVLPINIPTYIMNKAVAVTAAFGMLLSASCYLKNDKPGARDWGILSFHLAAFHVLLSLSLMSVEYYEGFFYSYDQFLKPIIREPQRMSFKGELTTLFGVLGIYCYFLLFRSKHGTPAMAYLKLLSTFFSGSHVFILGVMSWLPWTWGKKFNMPPVSLIGFICIGLAFLCYLTMKDAKKAQSP